MVSDVVDEWVRGERASGVGPEHHSFLFPSDASAPAVLLLHGAAGSPDDLRHLARFLHARGRTVLCPLLPGHGREPITLGDVRFRDLLETALRGHDALADGRRPVAMVAQSLGAVLGAHVAVRRPVVRFAALAPAFRPFVFRRIGMLGFLALFRPRLARAMVRWQRELLRGIRETRGVLPDLTCPLLVLHSRDDKSVSPRGGVQMHDRARSADKTLQLIDGQGHVLSRAPDRERLVYGPVVDFLDG